MKDFYTFTRRILKQSLNDLSIHKTIVNSKNMKLCRWVTGKLNISGQFWPDKLADGRHWLIRSSGLFQNPVENKTHFFKSNVYEHRKKKASLFLSLKVFYVLYLIIRVQCSLFQDVLCSFFFGDEIGCFRKWNGCFSIYKAKEIKKKKKSKIFIFVII